MLEPKDYQKYIDEDINPGDYIVRELDGQFLVGRVVELSPNFYRYQVLNAFPLGEEVVRHSEARKCYPAPLRKFKEGDVVIRSGLKGIGLYRRTRRIPFLFVLRMKLRGI